MNKRQKRERKKHDRGIVDCCKINKFEKIKVEVIK